ncbi:MAG: DUF1289 domain-containing protein [Rhodocyclaceae bacterium]|nr:DUF1289 domain-containing protein [Rhodocyclaceae bacterium]
MDEEDIPCVGICQPDPENGYCLGCGRRTAEFPRPAVKPATPSPAAPAEPVPVAPVPR